MVGRRQKSDLTTKRKAEEFEVLMPLLEAMFREFSEFAKKKPDGVLSESKVRIANRLLSGVYGVLDSEPSRQYLDLFDEDELPQNSDVMLMVGQTVAAMRAFREKYHRRDETTMTLTWATDGR